MKSKLKKFIHKLLGNNFQRLENYFYFLPQAIFWNIRYGFPSRKLKIIGVTGTDGKTTTSNMIYHILRQSNVKVGMVSTISAKIGEQDLDTGFHVTSPDPKDIQKYLKMMLDRGIEYVVLETTSHALDQFRYWGIKFDYAVYTNITQDHFDYHKNYENYLAAKLKLIDNLKEDGVVVANADDKSFKHIEKQIINKLRSGELLIKHLRIYGRNMEYMEDDTFDISMPIRPYKGLVFNEDEVITDMRSINFKIIGVLGYPITTDSKGREIARETYSNEVDIKIPMLGRYNIYNSLAAISTVGCILERYGVEILQKVSKYEHNQNIDWLQLNLENVVTSLSTFISLSGRMEIIQKGDGDKPMIIVDFAHTPNALEKALGTLNELRKPISSQQASTPSPRKELSRLIVVFGCAGLRDSSKRPMMGEVAARLADSIILVPEDPRTENLKDINDQIISGMQQPSVSQNETASYKEATKEIYRFDEPEVKSRELGIAKAIEIAKPQDIIVICGKGHEKSLCFGTTEYPYSDQEVVRKLLKIKS